MHTVHMDTKLGNSCELKMKANHFFKLATVAMIAASLTACGGGGVATAPTNDGGSNGGQNMAYTPSTATESATQTGSSCVASNYAANTAGEWMMGFRGSAGTYSAARGVVCQSATLDSAALAVAQSVAQSTPMTLAQLRSQWEASYGGEIIDVQHDEHGLTASDCAEAANFKARSLYIQGRLTDVGAYNSQNQDGSYSCVLVAGAKAGTHGMGQRPATDSSAVVHLVDSGNYTNRLAGMQGYIDVNFANASNMDTCAAGGRCLPAILGQIIGMAGPVSALASMGAPTSTTSEAVDYSASNRLTILNGQTVDSLIEAKNATIRYAFSVSCVGAEVCQVTFDYTAAGGIQKRLTLDYAWADRGTRTITAMN